MPSASVVHHENAPTLPSSSMTEVTPLLLGEIAISAYGSSLVLTDDAVYLLSSNAVYRLKADKPPQKIPRPLGVGATGFQSGLVFWENGGIWLAPMGAGVAHQVSKFLHRPQYFVAADNYFSWIDLSEQGLYTIQTIESGKNSILASSPGELSSLNMVNGMTYFVQRPSENSWRLGRVRPASGAPEYGAEHSGRRPSMLTGMDAIYYYDVDKAEVRRVSLDLQREETLLSKFVCSPIHVSSQIYCGCVEGVFSVSKEDSTKIKVLSYRPHGLVANVTSNSKLVAWTLDTGANSLAVYSHSVTEADVQPSP